MHNNKLYKKSIILVGVGVIKLTEINITYDLLFDILRIEKSREDLQKLDDKFYKNVIEYINTKESFIKDANTAHTERELTRIQLGNVKKLLTDLYERRERKIINLAIYKIKTGSGAINTDSLLEEEKYLFDSIYAQLSKYKSEILDNIVNGKAPMLNAGASYNTLPVKPIEDMDEDMTGVKSVRFVKAVPRFLGPELEIYGPFEENDIASLPSKIASILIKKNRAEEMNMSS